MSLLQDAFLGKPSGEWLYVLVTWEWLAHLKFFLEFRVASGFEGFLSKQFDGVFEVLDEQPEVKAVSASQHDQWGESQSLSESKQRAGSRDFMSSF